MNVMKKIAIFVIGGTLCADIIITLGVLYALLYCIAVGVLLGDLIFDDIQE